MISKEVLEKLADGLHPKYSECEIYEHAGFEGLIVEMADEILTLRKQKILLEEVYDRSVELRNGNLAEIKSLKEWNKRFEQMHDDEMRYQDEVRNKLKEQNKALIEENKRLKDGMTMKYRNGELI